MSSDWVWIAEHNAYWSPRSQAYARANPYAPTGWDYIPVSGSGQQTRDYSNSSHAAGEIAVPSGRSRVDYSDLQEAGRKAPTDDQELSREGDAGGIGNVGWGLDVVLPGEEPESADKGDPEVKTAGAATAMSAGQTANLETSTEIAKHMEKPKQPTFLRLVKVDSSSSPLSPDATLAILDSRMSGYLIGRDKHLTKPVLRLKELPVSKIHAIVWFGRRDKDLSDVVRDAVGRVEAVEDQHDDARRFWIADCGSTHGTFIEHVTSRASGEPTAKTSDPASDEVQTTRLSEARSQSAPYAINHLDRLSIGATTFECHLHSDWPCEACALEKDSVSIPIYTPDDPTQNPTVYASAATTGTSSGGIATVPGNWKETEERTIALTAEAKRADTHRRSALAMKKLKESYFGSGGGGGGSSANGEGKAGGKRKWGNKGDVVRDSDDGWKKKRATNQD